LVLERDQFAIAQIASGTGNGAFCPYSGKAHVVGNDAGCADAGPEGLDAARVAFMARLRARFVVIFSELSAL